MAFRPKVEIRASLLRPAAADFAVIARCAASFIADVVDEVLAGRRHDLHRPFRGGVGGSAGEHAAPSVASNDEDELIVSW